MRNLLNFISKNYFVFLFLFLETLSFLLIAHTHNHQRTFFLHSGQKLTGLFYKQTNDLKAYFSLRQVNKQLASENAQLLHKADFSYMEADTTAVFISDTLFTQRFTYVNARVINNSVIRRNNYLTLDKGSDDGIEKDMGVITLNGVVGIVKNVSRNFSTVISLLHKDMQISVRLKKNDHIGTLSWQGGNYRVATMSYIPSHVELNSGDTIISSGFSRMFPKEILIGTIRDFEIKRGENFFTANIDLALDFNKLSHVYVVNDLMAHEIEDLEDLNQILQ